MSSEDTKLIPSELRYEDIAVGDRFSFTRFVSQDMVRQFAFLTGDENPLHCDEVYAATTEFGSSIPHGMLVGSLFSSLVGMLIPGKLCLYLGQTLAFHHPLIMDSRAYVEGVVTRKSDAFKILDIKTTIRDESGKLIVDGVATVKVRNN